MDLQEITKMISVIAPNLNEVDNLFTFLGSLSLQTLRDFEIIVVDGGSTDGSLFVLMEFRHLLRKRNVELKVFLNKKRNLGFIRNLGAKHAKGDILFHCNTDNYLEPQLLKKVAEYYKEHHELASLSGRVYPLGTSIIAHLGYQLFDLLRFLFTCAPMPIKKYRPSGNFMSIRANVFRDVGGYPEVTVNEDGLFGQKLDPYVARNHKSVVFNLKLYVGHHVKKFEQMGGVHALMFYFYTLANFAPMLKPLLEPIRRNAGAVFQGKVPERLSFKTLLGNFWNWL
jgi:glycosyltransferase involved in cell wall biosynthesis